MNALTFGSRVRRVPVTRDGLAQIVRDLRPRDMAEIMAVNWDDDRDAFVSRVLAVSGDMCGIWEFQGVPVACLGVFALWPSVWGAFAFGTPDWPHVVLDMTRHVRRFIIPALLAVGAHRVECRALASHDDARKWLTALGAKQEATLRGFGRAGEDFVLYAWRPEDVLQQRRQQRPHGRATG